MLFSVISYVYGQFTSLYIRYIYPKVLLLYARYEPWIKTSQKLLVVAFVLFVLIYICFVFSLLVFGMFYYFNMPTIYHTFPIHWQYDRACIQKHRRFISGMNNFSTNFYENCEVTAKVDFKNHNKLVLSREQPYQVLILMKVPETLRNFDVGSFMIKMDIATHHAEKSVSLKYTSNVIKHIRLALFWPLYVFGVIDETQTLSVELFERLKFDEKCLSKFCTIGKLSIDAPDLQIYSSELNTAATFNCLQAILYKWPIISFCIGTLIIFTICLMSLLTFITFIIWKFSLLQYVMPQQSCNEHSTTVQAETIGRNLLEQEEEETHEHSPAMSHSSSIELVRSHTQNTIAEDITADNETSSDIKEVNIANDTMVESILRQRRNQTADV